ncbi:MAG TPA: aromatic ring-hydroxylating dioxygenase subunit alpha [Acidimicrobiales bacterium]|nr:aromatic ring-hydroxylating dioxygenase subunit alpha [Acidimicrobiales bacterium]
MAITEDRRPPTARTVPFAMRDPLHVPRERYYDREFFELEKEKLWPKAWQMACRLDEVPSPGDYVEYEICGQSIIVVRQPDTTIKAFFNACRHRATELCKGAGRLAGGQIVCPFHGWRWNLDGTSSFVYGAEAFDASVLQPEDVRLQECQVGTWGGCVWINMDPDARPLAEALSPGARFLDGVGVGNMRVWWWKETILQANWKMAQEAFLEGYHTMRTHPQLTFGAGERWDAASLRYSVFENGHSRFESAGINDGLDADQFIDFARVLWEGQDAMTLERDVRIFEGLRNRVPAGADFPTAAVAALYEYAAGAGIPMAPLSEAMSLWGGEVFLFPNYFMLPQFGNSLAYRIRPYNDDPECCRFEVWSLTTYPEGQEPGRAELKGRFARDDSDNWGLIPLQDFSNIERQQRGLHSRSFSELRLATEWERAISNMHEELDRYLAR